MANSPDGKPIRFQANSSVVVVDQLRIYSQMPATASSVEFMTQFAISFKSKTNKSIRTDTTDHFIADLIGHGWIKIVLNSQKGLEEETFWKLGYHIGYLCNKKTQYSPWLKD